MVENILFYFVKLFQDSPREPPSDPGRLQTVLQTGELPGLAVVQRPLHTKPTGRPARPGSHQTGGGGQVLPGGSGGGGTVKSGLDIR